jgi:hypothetical protein
MIGKVEKKGEIHSFLKKIYVLAVIGVMPVIAGILEIMRSNVLRGICLLAIGIITLIRLTYTPRRV